MQNIASPKPRFRQTRFNYFSSGMPAIADLMCHQKLFVRPQKWEDSQVGFRGCNASGRCIVLLPGAFWAHGASKMAILGTSFLLCILQCFRVWEGILPPGACRTSHASARRIVSCKALCVSSLYSQIPLAPAPTFGAIKNFWGKLGLWLWLGRPGSSVASHQFLLCLLSRRIL